VQASFAGAMSSQQAAYSATLTSELLTPGDKSQNPINHLVRLLICEFVDNLANLHCPTGLVGSV